MVFTLLHSSATADKLCARWLQLFSIAEGYKFVYKWFDVLNKSGHYIIGYTIMPNHLHVIIAFHNTGKSINSIVGNGKRFIAYDLIKALKEQGQDVIIKQMEGWVNNMKFLNHHLTGSLPGGRQGMQDRKIYCSKTKLYI